MPEEQEKLFCGAKVRSKIIVMAFETTAACWRAGNRQRLVKKLLPFFSAGISVSENHCYNLIKNLYFMLIIRDRLQSSF